MTGDYQPVHDPSIARQGSTYYVFSTDTLGSDPRGSLPVRCSADGMAWRSCGYVFSQIPTWVQQKISGLKGLWAPDISYFGGLYHLYYAASTLGTQVSVIGMATNVTLDVADPAYHWVDLSEVMESQVGDDFNAIDPNILVDVDGRIWLNYGSYWSGIMQREVDPRSGLLLDPAGKRYALATRPLVPNNPIEGASIVHDNGFYYLFTSIDYCCNPVLVTDNYKEAVGRSTSPHGPFVDEQGTPMLEGGGTVMLQTVGEWQAPGGGTAWVDPSTGQASVVFHALNVDNNGQMTLWMLPIQVQNGWPRLQ